MEIFTFSSLKIWQQCCLLAHLCPVILWVLHDVMLMQNASNMLTRAE